jgi:RNA polymerase sigma-70 factor (ECF subfamily)
MIFVCCHPLLPPEAQVALALKTLCGFGIEEISRAFLTNEAVIAKRLTRAKQKIREAGVAFEIPAGDELARRLDGVLQTVYLLFNEGYKASTGEVLLRAELCQEAIRLASLLAQHKAGNRPQVHALLALMLLNAARFPTRTDNEGNLLRLKDQDRNRWDRSMIARGLFHLAQSAAGDEMSPYHLQAGIAACHCAAPDYASTDWQQIRAMYDRLIQMDDSPVVALNRAVALSEVEGPKAGLEALAQARKRDGMDSYYLFYAVQGELEARLKRYDAAASLFRKSIELTNQNSERAFLMKRLEGMERTGAEATK